MYPHATNIKELAEYLGNLKTVHYRFMAERIDNEFQVTRLIVGPQATWERYTYSDVVFVAGTESGKAVADWLLSGTITTRDHESFPIMPLNTYVDSSRHPSHSRGGPFTLSKPFTMYRVSFSQAVPSRNYELTSEEAPFFLSLWEAERHLLYGIAEDAAFSSVQAPEVGVYVYIEHSDAWLERIHFSPTALELHLAGMFPMETKLKVVGSGINGYDNYPDSNTISIPLPNGRPDYLKIALLKGGTWLDYYIDDKNSRYNPLNPRRTNVTFAEPEPSERVRELIDRGEGKTIEFKQELKSSEKMKWLKTIVAFANGDGGSLIIGVNDEDGAVVGVNANLVKHNGSIAKFKDEIMTAINDTIDPVPEFEWVDAVIDGLPVLVVDMKASHGKCYAAYQNKDVPVYYIRRGATTRIADNNEVQELVKLKTTYLSVAPSTFTPTG